MLEPGPHVDRRGLPADDERTRAVWAELGASGAIAAVYRDGRPERGVDPEQLRALLRRLDMAQSTGTTLSACVQLATALPLLGEHARGSEAQTSTLSGRALTAFAATDAGIGTDLAALDTTILPSGRGLTVSGVKRWITNATTADFFLVLGRRREGPHFTNFSWVLIPACVPGLRVEPVGTGLFSGAGVGHLHLDAVALPDGAAVGGAGRGLPLFARHIAVERLAGAYWASAMCRRALVVARRWLMSRGDLWGKDAVRDAFARSLVLARQLDALADMAGPSIAERHDAAAAALVKSATGLAIETVIGTCAHLQGAEGFLPDGLQRLRTEAAVFGIAGGATELVLGSVADHAQQLLDGFAGATTADEL